MKSLEETIKLKHKFQACTESPLYFLPVPISFPRVFKLYESKNIIETEDEITLLEEITPLMVYIISCINYSESHYIDFFYKLRFDHSELILENNSDYIYEFMEVAPLHIINYQIYQTKVNGYYTHFSVPFHLEILVKQQLEDDMEVNHIEEEEEVEEEDKEKTINDLKTFKLEHCVICLENKPSVLFCNCGHICVCESCIKKFTYCPICKKENSVLRIIE